VSSGAIKGRIKQAGQQMVRIKAEARVKREKPSLFLSLYLVYPVNSLLHFKPSVY
jgi:hypothetical protein